MDTKYHLITKHGDDDYSLWSTEDLTDELQGYSIRGTLEDIKQELEDLLK